jgi:hypothetical protein
MWSPVLYCIPFPFKSNSMWRHERSDAGACSSRLTVTTALTARDNAASIFAVLMLFTFLSPAVWAMYLPPHDVRHDKRQQAAGSSRQRE